ncbi:MAG: SDR family oxidoreductase [Verrucomicrobiaceae bacterium]|nr:MAG: SDR family oxidoreductase [Verrucomicrobiaceae bacterium]
MTPGQLIQDGLPYADRLPGVPPVVVITGGQGTLGQAIAALFQEAGWKVLAPGKIELDVRRAGAVDAWFSRLERLDLLINNAGLRRDAPLLKLESGDWDQVMSVNLRGAFLCSRAAVRLMVRQKHGHIVGIGSHTARRGVAGQSAYGAAKAGLAALGQSLAAEFGPDNIRVNTVLPGWMPTAFNADLPAAAHEAARQRHLLGRFNTPLHTARFLLFLHQQLPHTSGQTFALDSRP